MKILLVAEYRDGKLLGNFGELIDFAAKIGGESAMFLVGGDHDLPKYDGTLYLADAKAYGEYNPDAHKQLILSVVEKEQADMVVFCHSSYGWDLAPRVAFALKAAQVSEVVEIVDGVPVVPVCNAKLRRDVEIKTPLFVDVDNCTGCKACLQIGCPAIEWDATAGKRGQAKVNRLLCVGCGQCCQVCNFDAFGVCDD